MSDESVGRSELNQEIAKAMVTTAQKLSADDDARASAAGLKDLAEALAWLTYPNQPH